MQKSRPCTTLAASVATSIVLGFAALAPAHAAENPQQNRMASCNKEAGSKKLEGDQRKAFMSQCLSNKPAPPMTQQEKMKACNKDAAGKKGDERKAFMSECLKG